ncbi:A/G-specific adenine glycosylase [Donghicola mangrovi]|uniref:Adenine DNA glycosylase n=1 Tax=Donghicola mangrovi TaxID=2729614 RepID=A0A850PZD1_9RHOB|nr:A/G-specific adenine glycosylase [Donghicola mangrovi]NVO22153.1 A/G-specific adenine glycosylase [Donghicola mangrovi]
MRDTSAIPVPKPETLLDWYDRHARKMPWRVGPAERKAGVMPDPYRIWMSEVMLQQTTVAAVREYFLKFTDKWPRVSDLAAAADADVMAAWAGLGYYARARNLLKCARAVAADYNGVFPQTYAELLKLPGVGPYTAAAVASISYDEPAVVVDGNVERVMSRVFNVLTPLPDAKPELTALAASLTPQDRPGDYAQAVMDLGATICTPRNPACGLCPWRDNCVARLQGTPADLPRKKPKKVKPKRRGIAYIARRVDGAYLLETRPESGLLGGMLGWPGSDWTESDPTPAPPIRAEWKTLNAEARHTFTHFHLSLTVLTALVPMERQPERGEFIPAEEFDPKSLPTVMRKAYDLTDSGRT